LRIWHYIPENSELETTNWHINKVLLVDREPG
jgi:hypothetical protein